MSDSAPYMWVAVGTGGLARKKQSTQDGSKWEGNDGKAQKIDQLDGTKKYSVFVTYSVEIKWKLNNVQQNPVSQTFIYVNGID